MSKILERLMLDRTETQRTDDFRPLQVSYTTKETRDTRYGSDRNIGWRLTLAIEVTFFANEVQLPYFREDAERCLLAKLYGPMLSLIDQARMAVNDGNRQAAYSVLDRMVEEVRP